jgi:hypothetical protein
MHIKHQDNPEFAVEFELPSGKTITYKAMPGAGPGLDSIAMPTLPDPTTYKAAMLTENWREWLRLFIAEIDGQIGAGCFHWAVLPEGHKLLNPVVVFTQISCTLTSPTSAAKREYALTTRGANLVSTRMCVHTWRN